MGNFETEEGVRWVGSGWWVGSSGGVDKWKG